jgi:hypothetical protein
MVAAAARKHGRRRASMAPLRRASTGAAAPREHGPFTEGSAQVARA